MAVLLTACDLTPQIMAVAAGAVYYLSEQSFLHHVHDHHFHLSVAAVFQQHAGNAGFLRDMNCGLGDFAREIEIRALIHSFLEEPLSGA